jgi:hypothetical protein
LSYPAGYPYRPDPLVPSFGDRRSQALAALACVALALALWLRRPWLLSDADVIALEVILPGALAFILAFAPSPATLANRIAKDLVVVFAALAVFAADGIVLMLVTVPAVLATAVYARSWGLAVIAVSFAVFDAIYAHWYNTAHIAHAMPDAWRRFAGEVPQWNLRWRPFVEGEAEVAVSRDGPARWLWDRLWTRACASMTRRVRVRSREAHEGTRLRYLRRDAGIDESGMIAAARVLEHGPLPFAMLGWIIRFPPVGALLQVVSGLAVRWWRRSSRGSSNE